MILAYSRKSYHGWKLSQLIILNDFKGAAALGLELMLVVRLLDGIEW